jgi:hypothetical protein
VRLTSDANPVANAIVSRSSWIINVPALHQTPSAA